MVPWHTLFAQHTLEQTVSTEAQRLVRWKRATDAYYGRYPDTIKVKPGKANDNVKINYARLIVDKGAAFLFGTDVQFEIDETKTTNEEEYLRRAWAKNRKMTLLVNAATNGGIYGHVFIRVLPATEAGGVPRLVLLDPMTVSVIWDEDDYERVERFTVTYNTVGPGETERQARRKRQRFERRGDTWQIVEEEGSPDGEHWRTISTSTWRWPFPPIVYCQNLPAPNEYWGMADLEDDVLDLIQAINFIYSNVRKINRYHAHPKTWGRGFTARQLEISTDELLILPSAEASLQNLEMSGDMGGSLAFVAELRQALFALARLPEVALGRMDGVGAFSGVALKLLFQPLIDKTESKRRLYGELLETLNSALLVLGGYRTHPDDVFVETKWPELLPKDMMEERTALQIDRALGLVSLETASQRLGYDFAMQQELRKREPQPPTPERTLPEKPDTGGTP